MKLFALALALFAASTTALPQSSSDVSCVGKQPGDTCEALNVGGVIVPGGCVVSRCLKFSPYVIWLADLSLHTVGRSRNSHLFCGRRYSIKRYLQGEFESRSLFTGYVS